MNSMTPSVGFMNNMALRKFVCGDAPSINLKQSSFPVSVHEQTQFEEPGTNHNLEPDVEIDLREVYFLILHFLSSGPCRRSCGQLWNELFENQLLPRRYHAWYSRNGMHSGHENDDGLSLPLSYLNLVERYPHVEKDHLVKLLKQLLLNKASPSRGMNGGIAPNAADVPTFLGTGAFSLLSYDTHEGANKPSGPPAHMRWPHMKADSVRGLSLREIGGGFSRHQRAPSIRAACYAIAKPSTMVQKMQNIKRLRGHRNSVYCAIFDRMGRYVITGSDDRLVKIWSMETAYCLASCRGHEGDITDLAVSSNNAVVASSSNDCVIRVWRLPDGLQISVLRGHTGAVTAIAFSPRAAYQLLSSSDDGTCRIWDARSSSQNAPRIYVPKPVDSLTAAARNNGSSANTLPQSHQIFCCAFNACGTIFVTGSSDTLARVWSACKGNNDNPDQPNHEMDVLAGHENDVNYVQFSGCAVASRFTTADNAKEDNVHKFKNSWFTHDNIVTCSRDGSAIIWVPRSRRSHGKVGRWTRAYHLKVPPPPMPPQPARGGPRQRILPTPRGVNMIIWSLDNRFVLAAIMDCRICVWNASDGSLVHSLTGHTESTYVLDVHPFNPRIAMSAGYDGKTIVWDIWEGTPIRTYEISHFKLVDGKFSSDGTSIILSDDVGQLYILSTGQGESQQDAKYDQFFLGDYRPLIQDTSSNVVDQETQLSTYRRNLQDLLCDSGMIPYPEPYQSAYQQRRLGAMGIEWRPSSLKLSAGPDFNLDPDYQLLPLADLDILVEPLPEIVDAMDWGPENEVQSDDTDSEYNVTEDYSTGGEQRSLNFNSSSDPECSSEDTGIEDTPDGLRRSKRKKPKAEMEVLTSSGRRVKRRNLDEFEGDTLRSKSRKSKYGHKSSKKKLASKSRPQRAAARNARNWISSFKGKSTDGEDEYESEGYFSESESTLQGSDLESDEYERSLQNRNKHSKGKEVLLVETEDVVKSHDVPESHVDSGYRKRLVLKISLKNSNKGDRPLNTTLACSNMADAVGSSSRSLQEVIEPSQNLMRSERQLGNTEGHSDLTEVYTNGNIRWGGCRARTSKRIRLGETVSSDVYERPSSFPNSGHNENENIVQKYLEQDNHLGALSPNEKIQNFGDQTNTVALTDLEDGLDDNANLKNGVDDNASDHSRNVVNGGGLNSLSKLFDGDESNKLDCMLPSDATATSIQNGTTPPKQTESTPIPTKIRFKNITWDPEYSSKHKIEPLNESLKNNEYKPLSGSPQHLIGLQDIAINGTCSDHRNDYQQDGGIVLDKKPLTLCNSEVETNKMYTAVYRRSKSHKGKGNMESNGCGSGENATCVGNITLHAEADSHTSMHEGPRKMRSLRLKDSSYDLSNMDGSLKSEEEQEPEHKSRRAGISSANRSQIPCEEWASSSRMTVGSRSTRNRRGSYTQDLNPIDRRKTVQFVRKVSWLMMPAHEGGSRYIPQLGDEVAYLRQGHHEYLDHCCGSHTKEMRPWTSLEGNIKDVEFCKIVELVYSTSAGSGESCCKMLLEFIDPASCVYRQSFKLTLPELIGFPDFLVERTRFDAAMQRNWRFRDKCRVWWKNDVGVDGSWWDGRIISVQAKSPEFPDSPWERYTIKYRSDPTEPHLHSPWELYDTGTLWEQPHIDDETKSKLLLAFDKLMSISTQGRYGLRDLIHHSRKPQYKNRFPVPLCLDIIQERLQNDYYRSLEALKHDFMVMLSNFESLAKNEDMLKKVRRLSEWFTRHISSL